MFLTHLSTARCLVKWTCLCRFLISRNFYSRRQPFTKFQTARTSLSTGARTTKAWIGSSVLRLCFSLQTRKSGGTGPCLKNVVCRSQSRWNGIDTSDLEVIRDNNVTNRPSTNSGVVLGRPVLLSECECMLLDANIYCSGVCPA